MKTKKSYLMLALSLSALLAACSSTTSSNSSTAPSSSQETAAESTQTGNTQSTDTDSEEVKDDEIEIDAEKVTSSSIDLSDYSKPVEISAAGTYTISGKGSSIIVDAPKADVTLVLNNVQIENSSIPAIYVRKAGNVTLELKGTSTLSTTSSYTYEPLNACVYSKADLAVKGSGTLNIDAGYGHGIKAKDTADFSGGTLNIVAAEDGIHINEEAVFSGGSYTIQSSDEGIQSETSLYFKGGTYKVQSSGDGLRAETVLTVDDGTYAIVTSSEGMESKDSMVINGGTIEIQAQDDGINAINSLIINGGTVTAVSSGNDGIDSNGDLIINGGIVTAIGLKTPETSFDVDNTPFEIHGGTVMGAGSNLTYPTKVDENILYIGLNQSASVIRVKEGNTTIMEMQIPSTSASFGGMGSGMNLLLASDKLQLGNTYDIYADDSLVQSVTLSQQATTIGSVSTMGGGMGGKGQMGGFGTRPGR